ncbi:DUF5134 domain-containing protein [Streptomyces celluloflavus]|uniref:DUF5134 domain-containing protein n=1 Tax=Streptomyces celluloflavus TaxID=58344 RepID=A0ABW7R8V4_9ACTN|nr:DUF5134 domain-containing protein [Streptomyces celluloflavus]
MHGPPWVGWLLVVLCAATGAYCLSRVGAGGAAQRREARGEALMGLGMAVMALPMSVVVQPSWSPWVFATVFGAAGLWALAHRHPHHLVGCAAMVYMALAMTAAAGTGSAGHAAHTGHTAPGGVPVLTGLLLAYYAVFVIAAGLRLAPAGAVAAGGPPAGAVATADGPADAPDVAGPGGRSRRGSARPELIGACRVAMGIGMFAMLLTL